MILSRHVASVSAFSDHDDEATCWLLPSLLRYLVLSFGGFTLCEAQAPWSSMGEHTSQAPSAFTRSQKTTFLGNPCVPSYLLRILSNTGAQISPTEELIWTDCYSDNQCARLKVMGESRALMLHLKMNSFTQVPLDYAHPYGASAAIVMIRIHSTVSHDSPNYRGPILINPGSLGGSGLDLAIWRGALISTVGPEFDIIGFHSRSVSSH
jgi:hypothetical protein